jgi:hypothetical protein
MNRTFYPKTQEVSPRLNIFSTDKFFQKYRLGVVVLWLTSIIQLPTSTPRWKNSDLEHILFYFNFYMLVVLLPQDRRTISIWSEQKTSNFYMLVVLVSQDKRTISTWSEQKTSTITLLKKCIASQPHTIGTNTCKQVKLLFMRSRKTTNYIVMWLALYLRQNASQTKIDFFS